MSEEKDFQDFIQFLKERAASGEIQISITNEQNKQERIYDDGYISELLKIYEKLSIKNEFAKGQLVQWKVGLKNRKLPHENQPAIVIDVLDKPVYNKDGAGSPYFREPLDIILGIIERGEFFIFHYDKRRFEPFENQPTNGFGK